MKRFFLVLSFITATFFSINAQGIPYNTSYGSAVDRDTFSFGDKKIGNYSLGWYSIPGSAEALFSAYGGFKFFTRGNGIPKLSIDIDGKLGLGELNPLSPLSIKSTNDAIMSFKTTDNTWLYTNFFDKEGKRRAYVGLDRNLSSYTIGIENGTDKIVVPRGKLGLGELNPLSPLSIKSTNDAIMSFKTTDNTWLYTNFFDKEGKRRAYVGLDRNLSSYIIGIENGTDKIVVPRGNVGIGELNPFYKFEWSNGTHNGFLDFTFSGNAIGSRTGNLGFWTNGGEKMTILKNGNIGIGTTKTGSHRLAVEGSIGAREIKVQASGWSDFVFYEDYKLPTLKEVEAHINEKGHLKDIPNAAEVEKEGFYLGNMNAKLLQKIEELTLYTIQQEKKIEDFKEKEDIQEAKIEMLLKRLVKLEAKM